MPTKSCLLALAASLVLATCCQAAPPLKALIVDGQNNHNWKGTTPIFKKQLEETGLFSVDVATSPPRGDDVSGFRPAFAEYDVVIDNYNGAGWSEQTKKDLVDYVRGGGGLVVIHAANNAFRNWEEFNRMIGIGWGRTEKDGPFVRWADGEVVYDDSPGRGGSHGSMHPFQVNVRAPEHPIMKGLPKVFMHAKEELYNRLRGPAENMTVLATAFSPKEKRGSGFEEPILMAIDYGKGRVFHTVLGHAPEPCCTSVAFAVTFQRGAEWAATGKVSQAVPDDFPTADEASVREY